MTDDEGTAAMPTDDSDQQPADERGRVFRVLVVPGVNPDRWLRVWRARLADVPLELVVAEPAEAEDRLRDGAADVAIVRLPVDRGDLSAIPLYTETTVVVAARDHVFSVAEEVTPADLADETVIRPDDDLVGWSDAPGEPFTGGPVPTTADAVDLVAAGVGVALFPQSVERLHHRRGVVARPVPGAPGSQVALVWCTDRHDDDLVEEFIGIVRGRTAASSRGRGAPASDAPGTSGGAGGRSGGTSGKSGGTSGKSGGTSGRSGGKPGTRSGAGGGSTGTGRSGDGRGQRATGAAGGGTTRQPGRGGKPRPGGGRPRRGR